MDKKLLICIAHHYVPEKLIYLKQVVERFLSYNLDVTIIIDTNSYELLKYLNYHNVYIYANNKLEHPHHLAWLHRQHIKDFIDDFDYFMYIEDDIDLPFKNFVEYLNNFELLFPNYVPSFIRVETLDGIDYAVDVQKQQKINNSNIIKIGDKKFISLNRPYHAFWIMPHKELKETISNDFINYCKDRELAASYPMSGLSKKPLIMLDNNKISNLCYSYHLPNKYVNMIGVEHKFGRIELDNLLEIL